MEIKKEEGSQMGDKKTGPAKFEVKGTDDCDDSLVEYSRETEERWYRVSSPTDQKKEGGERYVLLDEEINKKNIEGLIGVSVVFRGTGDNVKIILPPAVAGAELAEAFNDSSSVSSVILVTFVDGSKHRLWEIEKDLRDNLYDYFLNFLDPASTPTM
jgi:hypothetical protein